MCEGRERGEREGEPDEENESVNPRGEVEAGLDQVQKEGPVRREFSKTGIIRITTAGASRRGGSSNGRGGSPGHESLGQQERQLQCPADALVAEGEAV
jgi:hypothetical protein